MLNDLAHDWMQFIFQEHQICHKKVSKLVPPGIWGEIFSWKAPTSGEDPLYHRSTKEMKKENGLFCLIIGFNCKGHFKKFMLSCSKYFENGFISSSLSGVMAKCLVIPNGPLLATICSDFFLFKKLQNIYIFF